MKRVKFGWAITLAVVGAMAASAAVQAAGRGDPSTLDGVYRVSWTEQEAIADGAPYRSAHADFGFAHGKPVVITITLRDGRFSLRDTSHPPCSGSYRVSGQNVSIHERPPACKGDISARWSLQGRLLRLHVTKATDPGDAVVFGGKPWRKIA